MKILKYNKFLEEININLSELEKPIGNDKRGDVLVDKLKDPTKTINIAGKGDTNITQLVVDNQDKPTEDGIKDITDEDGRYDPIKSKKVFVKGNRYQKVLKSDDGGEFSLNQIVKDKDFGSKGPGTHTRMNETIQCLYLALKISQPNLELNIENVNNFLEAYKSNSLNNIELYLNDLDKVDINNIQALNTNKDWVATLTQVPEQLYSFRNGILFDDAHYSVFHISNKSSNMPVLKLINRFNFLRKQKVIDSETGRKVENDLHSVDFSKFCPADVYVIKTEYIEEINKAIDASLTIQDLSNNFDNFFDDKKMIPISLKKIRSIVNGFSFKVIINKERGTKPPTFDIDDFIVTKNAIEGISSRISTTSRWTRDDDSGIERGQRSMTIDSSDTSKNNNVCGEIDGAIARHGKVSFTVIKKLIDSKREMVSFRNIIEIQTHKELSQLETKTLTLYIKNLWQKLMTDDNNNINVKSVINGRAFGELNKRNKMISKLQSLQILYAIYQISQIDGDLANELVTSIMSYALSININMFSTPRYIRII